MVTRPVHFGPSRRFQVAAAVTAITLAATSFAGARVAAAQAVPLVVSVAPGGTGSTCDQAQPCSLATGQQKVRDQVAGGLDREVVIELAEGTYAVSEAIVLDDRDSGTPEFPVTWRAAAGASPVLDGGVAVTGWSRVAPGSDLWRGRAADGGKVRQLFVDGARAQRASGVRCEPAACTVTDMGITGPGVQGMLSWARPSDLEVSIKVRWRNFRCGVDRVSGSTLVMEQPCWLNSSSDTGRFDPRWHVAAVDSANYRGVSLFENAVELIDEPGEYAHNSATGDVTYLAEPGQDMTTVDAVTPRTETLLRLAGTVAEPVHDLVIDGIGFEHAAFLQPDTTDGYAGTQAGFTLTGATGPLSDVAGRYFTKPAAAVRVETGRDITVTNGEFRHLGGAGIRLEQGTQRSAVTGSRFTDLSGGAIYTGDTEPNPTASLESRDNTYERNTISNIGTEFTDAVAIWGGYESTTSISHNTIEEVPYSGISLGWGWNAPGARSPFSRDNRIESNRIIDTMMPWAEQIDGGSIYTQAPQPGTMIAENYIHKTTGNGVYLDEQSSYIRVERNVVTGMSAPTWLSNWASYGIQNVATGNWSSANYRAMNGTGSVQYDNHESLTSLPAEAVTVAGAAGAAPPGVVYPIPQNVALGKQATQSSTYALANGTPYPAGNAVDGNTTNFAHTAAGDAQPWWQVDLGSSADVDAIRLWNRSDCCQDRLQGVYVFVSDQPFTSENPTQTASQPGVWSTFLTGRAARPSVVDVSAHGRYVRVQLASTTAMLNVAEVQILGT
ncbi:right-handed parallel beta-helix repeat-containing protein [Isoptericola hypogeus]|uniref:Right-handed parallel beta-helix repeat-containing protein n=2 Tax=Isoptericola hypogeus TaxID=300179 RepID=A0ABN2JG38_9MICO